MEFTNKIIGFLLHIYKNKDFKVMKSTQKLDTISYYMMINYLKDEGIVLQTGMYNQQKVWRLTPRGIRVAKLLVELKKEMDEIFEGTKENNEVKY